MRTLVYLSNPEECDSLGHAGIDATPQFMAAPQDVVAALKSGPPPKAIVWSIDPALEEHLLMSISAARASSPAVLQVFRVTLGEMEVSTLLSALRMCSSNVEISLRGRDVLCGDLHNAVGLRSSASVEVAIIARLASSPQIVARRALAKILVGAVLLGGNRPSVQAFADALGLTLRKLRESVHGETGLEPRTLLRWTFILNCIGEAESGRRPLKVIARDAGYRRPEALTNRMARLSGMRLRQTLAHGGFVTLLDEFERILAVRSLGVSTAAENVVLSAGENVVLGRGDQT